MVYVKCPACGNTEFNEDEEDPDYYTCAKCETVMYVNLGGILTQHERNELEKS